ncbi:IS3 family transposase [Paenibacillus lautus]
MFESEFANQTYFLTLEQLDSELHDYVHWFNHHLIHEILG